MPTYQVQMNVNVPGVGQRTFTATNIVSADIQSAIDQAVAQIIVEAVAVQKTSV